MLAGRIAGARRRVELPERLGVVIVVISEDARFIQRFGRRCHQNSLFGDFLALYTALFRAECTIGNGVARCRIHAV
ncbi:hypothetical protein D3C72_1493500 [compost metagenome]